MMNLPRKGKGLLNRVIGMIRSQATFCATLEANLMGVWFP